ncbi:MAPEG family protein [Kordiimonas sp.]|uniref:MAPEG family protein n=1 Tax=Kordiimonas sp. TaxID=1970157 RepID=UPI003A931870
MTITLITASFLGLLLIYLSFNVSKHRGRAKVSIGDGGDDQLAHAIRAHGNLIEFAPMALILLGLLEYQGLTPIIVIVLGAAFVLGRLMHGLTFGKFEGRNPYRFWGTILTWLVILIACVLGLLKGYHII